MTRTARRAFREDAKRRSRQGRRMDRPQHLDAHLADGQPVATCDSHHDDSDEYDLMYVTLPSGRSGFVRGNTVTYD